MCIRDRIQEVEKIIEVPIEKIVERPVIKEIIKEKPIYIDRIVEEEVEVPVEKIIEVPVEEIIEVPVEVIVERPVFVEKKVYKEKKVYVNKKENKNVINVEEEDPKLRMQVSQTDYTIRDLNTKIARLRHEISEAQNIELRSQTKSTINYEVQNQTLKKKIEELKRNIQSTQSGTRTQYLDTNVRRY